MNNLNIKDINTKNTNTKSLTKSLTKGLLITLEGIDGSGKSSLAQSLYDYLKEKFTNVILTKEPGGSKFGKSIRDLLQKEELLPLSEFLIFAADRAQHFNEVIVPALNNNYIVISDRMADSSLAYQGYAKKLNINLIKEVNKMAMQSIEPDIVIFTKVNLDVAIERISKRNLEYTKFEREHAFLQTVANGYDQIFKNRKNVITIDANKDKEDVFCSTIKEIEKWMDLNGLIL